MRPWLLQLRIQALGFLREPAAVVFNLAVPLFIVVFQAMAFGEIKIGEGLPEYRVVDLLPLNASLMYIMTLGLFGVSIGIASMIESRTLAGSRLRVGGVSSVVSAYIVVLVGLLFAGILLSSIVARVFWSVPWPNSLWGFSLAIVVTAGPFYGLGILVSSLITSPRSAQAVASALFFPFLFLSGSLFPADSFPTYLQGVARSLPGYHAYEVLAAAFLPGQPFPVHSLIYLVVLSFASIGLAFVAFSRREDL